MSKLTKADEIISRLAINAKCLRKARKLTLQEVADRAELAKSYVWELEKGHNTNPSLTVVLSLAGALGCSVSDLIGDEKFIKPQIRPEAMRIAVQVDHLLRAALKEQSNDMD